MHPVAIGEVSYILVILHSNVLVLQLLLGFVLAHIFLWHVYLVHFAALFALQNLLELLRQDVKVSGKGAEQIRVI